MPYVIIPVRCPNGHEQMLRVGVVKLLEHMKVGLCGKCGADLIYKYKAQANAVSTSP
jgi:hypothetical protein